MQRRSQYGREERDRARELRKSYTDAEDKIWFRLKNRVVGGAKFRRQHPIKPYTLDFYCHEHRLAIEIDGSQHYEPDGLKRDVRRTAFLASKGIRVLRFNSREALLETDAVMNVILEALQPSPNPLPGGEGFGNGG